MSTRAAVIRNADRTGARGRLVKRLAAEFKIEDADGLRETIDAAAEVYQRADFDSRQGRKREAKQLKQLLDRHLPKILELLTELRQPIVLAASRNVYGEAALVRENYGKVARAYTDLLDRLEEVGDVARGLPRRGRKQGKRGGHDVDGQPVDYGPLRKLMDVVANDYWRGKLERNFSQNQNELGWDEGGKKPSRSANDAVRFSFQIIEHIAPGQGVCLKTIAREYTDSANCGSCGQGS